MPINRVPHNKPACPGGGTPKEDCRYLGKGYYECPECERPTMLQGGCTDWYGVLARHSVQSTKFTHTRMPPEEGESGGIRSPEEVEAARAV